jgi:hypothetical protein
LKTGIGYSEKNKEKIDAGGGMIGHTGTKRGPNAATQFCCFLIWFG